MARQLFLFAVSLAVAASGRLSKRFSIGCARYQECLSPLQGPLADTVCKPIENRDMNCEDDIRSTCGDDGERLAVHYMTWVDHDEYACQPEVKAKLEHIYDGCMRRKMGRIHSTGYQCWERNCPDCQSMDDSCQAMNVSRSCVVQCINEVCPGSEQFHYDYYSRYFTRMAQRLNCPWP